MTDEQADPATTAAPAPPQYPQLLDGEGDLAAGRHHIAWRLSPEIHDALRHIPGDQLGRLGEQLHASLRVLITKEAERMAAALPALAAGAENGARVEIDREGVTRLYNLLGELVDGPPADGDTVAAGGDAAPAPAPPTDPPAPPPPPNGSRGGRTALPPLDVGDVLQAIRKLDGNDTAATRNALALELGITANSPATTRRLEEAIAHLERDDLIKPGPTFKRGPTWLPKESPPDPKPPAAEQAAGDVPTPTVPPPARAAAPLPACDVGPAAVQAAGDADRLLREHERRIGAIPGVSGRTRRRLAREAAQGAAAGPGPLVVPDDGTGTLEGRILAALQINTMNPLELAAHLDTPVEIVAPAALHLVDEGELRKLPGTRPAQLARVLA